MNNSINTGKTTYLVALIGLLFLLNTDLNGQSISPPFSKIELTGSVSSDINDDLLSNYWTSGKGIAGAVGMPFYWGSIQVGALLLPFKSKSDRYPDYNSLMIFLGWGRKIKLPLNLDFYAGLKIGTVSMDFNDDTVNTHLKTESELAAGLNFRLDYNFAGNFALNISAEATRIFTHKRIELLLISGGLSYTFNSPKWFKDFFN